MHDVFRNHGCELTPEIRDPLIGVSVDASSVVMAGHFPDSPDPAAVGQELCATVLALIKQNAEPMPGAQQVVRAVAAAGVPHAVASNSPADIVYATLERGGMLGDFETVITADDIKHPKPEPEIYLTACARLGADPLQAVGFEDTLTGALAVRAAGMRVIFVPTLPVEAPADWILPSLDSPELLAWIRSW